MKTAIGLYAKRIHRDLGDTRLNVFSELAYALDLEISHYCYSGDDKRDPKGFKYEQTYYLNGSDIKAITKRFEENVDVNGNITLVIYFDYYGGVYKDINGDIQQDLIITKSEEKIYKYGSKSLNYRRFNQRSKAIDDLKSLGFYFESLSVHYPHLVGYEDRMKRIFTAFQLEIDRFVSTASSDFANALISSLSGSDTQLIEDLNTMVPTVIDGVQTTIETWKGIYNRLV